MSRRNGIGEGTYVAPRTLHGTPNASAPRREGTDAAGRGVILHGVNVVHKAAP